MCNCHNLLGQVAFYSTLQWVKNSKIGQAIMYDEMLARKANINFKKQLVSSLPIQKAIKILLGLKLKLKIPN